VKRMLVDSRGLLWICTGSGLSRFDGAVFENFGLAEGLPFPSINDLIETPDGDFWLASNGGGVIRVRLSGGARRYTAIPVSAEPTSNRVNRLFRASNGAIWAGTDGGLFRMTTTDGPVVFTRVALKLRGHPDEAVQIWSMTEDRKGGLWVGTRFGLVHLPSSGRIASYPLHRDLENDDVLSLAYAPDGDLLWVGHRAGLLVFKVPAGGVDLSALAEEAVDDASLIAIMASPPQSLDAPTELPPPPASAPPRSNPLYCCADCALMVYCTSNCAVQFHCRCYHLLASQATRGPDTH